MRKKADTILALDPGLRDLGYAVLSGKSLVTSGVLSLRPVHPSRRLKKVEESIGAWSRAYRPRVLVLESIPKRPLDTIAGLPALGRLLRRLASRRGFKLAAYSAKTVRRTITGNGWAGKREAAQAVSARFPELRVHLNQTGKWRESYWQNMFDAIALALHHQTVMTPPSRSRLSG
jgi:Holliday junction resolvasome RuvABC endonuclease subunit